MKKFLPFKNLKKIKIFFFAKIEDTLLQLSEKLIYKNEIGTKENLNGFSDIVNAKR